jgi:hypothetical protein
VCWGVDGFKFDRGGPAQGSLSAAVVGLFDPGDDGDAAGVIGPEKVDLWKTRDLPSDGRHPPVGSNFLLILELSHSYVGEISTFRQPRSLIRVLLSPRA